MAEGGTAPLVAATPRAAGGSEGRRGGDNARTPAAARGNGAASFSASFKSALGAAGRPGGPFARARVAAGRPSRVITGTGPAGQIDEDGGAVIVEGAEGSQVARAGVLAIGIAEAIAARTIAGPKASETNASMTEGFPSVIGTYETVAMAFRRSASKGGCGLTAYGSAKGPAPGPACQEVRAAPPVAVRFPTPATRHVLHLLLALARSTEETYKGWH